MSFPPPFRSSLRGFYLLNCSHFSFRSCTSNVWLKNFNSSPRSFRPVKILRKKRIIIPWLHEASYSAKTDSQHDLLGSRQDENRASNAVKLIHVVSREVLRLLNYYLTKLHFKTIFTSMHRLRCWNELARNVSTTSWRDVIENRKCIACRGILESGVLSAFPFSGLFRAKIGKLSDLNASRVPRRFCMWFAPLHNKAIWKFLPADQERAGTTWTANFRHEVGSSVEVRSIFRGDVVDIIFVKNVP